MLICDPKASKLYFLKTFVLPNVELEGIILLLFPVFISTDKHLIANPTKSSITKTLNLEILFERIFETSNS